MGRSAARAGTAGHRWQGNEESSGIMKALKFLVGILLLPCCWAITRTLISLVQGLQPSSAAEVPAAAWFLVAGFLLWAFLYFAAPPPMRTYVLAHELTHALWGAFMGARIKRMKVGREGGSVTLTKTNFLIALAPYFFPLYTVLVALLYFTLSFFVPVGKASLWWMALVGFTWAFHVTFTISTLARHQTDVQDHGRLFSYTVIYGANILGICLWLIVVSPATLRQFVTLLGQHARGTAGDLIAAAGAAAAWMRGRSWEELIRELK
jgi:hypothetical protein